MSTSDVRPDKVSTGTVVRSSWKDSHLCDKRQTI